MITPSDSPATPPAVPKIVPWLLWGAIVAGFVMINVLLGGKAKPTESDVALVGLVPVALSVLVRLLVMPRLASLTTALPAFIVCLALADAGGLMGVLFGGRYAPAVIGAAFVVLVLHNPMFALGRFGSDERGRRAPRV